MVFVFTRALLVIPAIQRLGEVGIVSVVWSCIAAACFFPTSVINWRAVLPNKQDASPAVKVRAAAAADSSLELTNA